MSTVSFPSHRSGPVLARRSLGLLAALLAPVLLAAPARGDAPPSPQRKAEASAFLVRGAELIDAEDLEGALAQFEAAYRLVPSPNILHNFGIVYQGLGRKAAALEAFERFLSEAPRAPAAARTHAERAVQALIREVAAVQVRSDLPGARIFVDGRNVGQTPRALPVYLDPGPHHLSVEKEEVGAVFTERVEVAAGQQLTLQAQLAGPMASLTATDGLEVGSGPAGGLARWQRPAAWAALVGAAVASGVLVSQLLARQGAVGAFNDRGCGTEDPERGGADCPVLFERIGRAGTRAMLSALAMAAFGSGAVALYVTLPQPLAGSAGAPVRMASPLGLGLKGRF